MVLQENIENRFSALSFKPYSPFYESFNKLMGELADVGLLKHWNNLELEIKFYKKKIEEIGPQVLTMEHLMVGFQICMAALSMSVIAFVGEYINLCFKKKSMKAELKVFTTQAKKLKSKKYQKKKNSELPKSQIATFMVKQLKPTKTDSSDHQFFITKVETVEINRKTKFADKLMSLKILEILVANTNENIGTSEVAAASETIPMFLKSSPTDIGERFFLNKVNGSPISGGSKNILVKQ